VIDGLDVIRLVMDGPHVSKHPRTSDWADAHNNIASGLMTYLDLIVL